MAEPTHQQRELAYLLTKIQANAYGAGDKARANELLRREVMAELAKPQHQAAIQAAARRARIRQDAAAAGVAAGTAYYRRWLAKQRNRR